MIALYGISMENAKSVEHGEVEVRLRNNRDEELLQHSYLGTIMKRLPALAKANVYRLPRSLPVGLWDVTSFVVG